MTGSSTNFAAGTSDAVTIKYDSAGNQLWTSIYANSVPAHADYAVKLAVDSSGTVYIGGYSFNGANMDYVVLRYDPAGQLLAVARHNSGYDDYLSDMVVDGAGHIYATGTSSLPATQNDYETVKFSPTGGVRLTSSGPDLVLTQMSTSVSSVARGGTIAVTNSVKNQGNASAGASSVGFRLSPNSVYGDSDDISITTTRSVTSLGAGLSNTATTNVIIPSTATPGVYYICGISDRANAIVETFENNNSQCTNTMITVTLPKSDLIMTALSTATRNVNRGQSFSLANTVQNQGMAPAQNFQIKFVLSVNSVIGDADDVALTPQRSVANLAAGATSNASTLVTVPATTLVGTYYIGAIADSGNVVDEQDEGNNTRTATRTINVR